MIKKKIEFTVYGDPKGKARPRVVRRGGFIRTYTPQQTVDYEDKIKKSYYVSYNNVKLKGPISAKIEATFEIPKSTSKKNQLLMLEGKIKHTKKPDCDNLAKAVLDALNNIAYNDDSQICDLYTKKLYGKQANIKIILEEI